MRLEPHHTALVLEHMDVAIFAANEIRTAVLTREERISAAYYGLCRAALKWEGRCLFSTFARRHATWMIRNDIRATCRWGRRNQMCATPADEAAFHLPDLGSQETLERLEELPERQRVAMRLRIAGMSWDEVGTEMGVTTMTARMLGVRAVARLRAAIGVS